MYAFYLTAVFFVVSSLVQSTSAFLHSHSAVQPSSSTFILYSEVSRKAGESALQRVEWLGRLAKQKELSSEEYFGKSSEQMDSIFALADERKRPQEKPKYDANSRVGGIYANSKKQSQESPDETTKERQVWTALANLEADSTYLPIDIGAE